MKSKLVLYILTAALLLNSCKVSQPTEAKGKWISLFNGKDIKDWYVKINHHEVGDNFANTFRVEDGMIRVKYDGYGDFNDQFGHLYYKTPFSYYHLVVEYRLTGEWQSTAPKHTHENSGVMFHSQDPRTMLKDQDWPISIEMQFLASLGDGKPRPTCNMCSPGTKIVYDGKLDERHCISSSSKTYQPNEWVRAELIVLGDSLITHIVNGDTVMRYSKPQIGGGVVTGFDPAMKPDGKLLSSGFIALQSEGQPVDFRKVELLDLSRQYSKNKK
ncbi:MAG: hypothetical protein K0S09_1391 [Sphingobacteriaceae bacterium]|jgi:hypothetical protein|nr:hypothetical protein [Sphingobacteriaceae bacterium]